MAWDVRGKNVLVTGATSGIGLEASVELARRGARVVMVGRDPGRTEAAVADVIARSGSSEVSHLLCDFSSQADDPRARRGRPRAATIGSTSWSTTRAA